MKKFRVVIIAIGIIGIAYSFVFVPFSGPKGNLGYSYIYTPKQYSSYDFEGIEKTTNSIDMRPGKINYETVFMQNGALLIMLFGFYFATKKR